MISMCYLFKVSSIFSRSSKSFLSFRLSSTTVGAPRGYGEQGNLLLLLLRTWEHKQLCQGNLATKWILGSSLEFLLKEQSKNIFGNKGDFGNFSREHGNTDPPGGLSRFLIKWLLIKKPMLGRRSIQA